MPNPRYLTKSRFQLAVDCPTKLFYAGKSEYENSMASNDLMAMLAEGGYQVGALAKLRYPMGIEITATGNQEAAEATAEYLKQDKVVLFEPAIIFGDFLIRIDILVKDGNRFDLIEVKAKSFNSLMPEIESARGGISSGMRPYIQDAAFQTWVLGNAYPGTDIKTWLMMPDKSKQAPVDGINQMFKVVHENGRESIDLRPADDIDLQAIAEQLLAKVNVDQYVNMVITNPLYFPGGPMAMDEAAAKWAGAYKSDEKIPPKLGSQCGSCQFVSAPSSGLRSGRAECWSSVLNGNESSVLDIWNFRGKKKLIDNGVYRIADVQREDIGPFDDEPDGMGLSSKQRQWLQVNGLLGEHAAEGYYFDHALFRREMGNWTFPLHMVDFETSTVALPFYKGMRPYEPVAFQFSHHVIEQDGRVSHRGEFLSADPGHFPNYEFVRALMGELDTDGGSIFMWSPHENTILTKIRDQLYEEPNLPADRDALIVFIESVITGGERAMIDLCDLACRGFYHPETKGSNSIKKVLPATLKISPYLKNTYSKPIYGAPGGIHSKNFASVEGFAWLDGAKPDVDPYQRLKDIAGEVLAEAESEQDDSSIADGGAALTAYARLQFEDLPDDVRQRIKAALLRYCELDTMAMVMIVEAWRELAAGGAQD